MTLFKVAFGVLCCGVIVLVCNPFGLSQRFLWGMAPPYRWVQQDMSEHTNGSLDESYVGTNGKICARLYRYGTDDNFEVFGYGFSEKYATREDAERLAARECR